MNIHKVYENAIDKSKVCFLSQSNPWQEFLYHSDKYKMKTKAQKIAFSTSVAHKLIVCQTISVK